MYKVETINDTTKKIIDQYGEDLYLLEGKDKALLIDAGMEKEDIDLFDYVSSLTDKPVILALSHGHIDHIGQSGSFDEVYMSHLDKDVYLSHQKMDVGHFSSDGLNFKDVNEIKDMISVFSLGNRDIDVIALGGHTPGSVIFVDKDHKMVFTGDAIGSGCGVWMQLDESLSIPQYFNNLNKVIEKLKEFNVDLSWDFYGGHEGQEYMSQVSDFNRLDLAMIYDMKELCQNLIDDQISYHPVDVLSMSHKPYYVSLKKAEMIVTKEKVKG